MDVTQVISPFLKGFPGFRIVKRRVRRDHTFEVVSSLGIFNLLWLRLFGTWKEGGSIANYGLQLSFCINVENDVAV